MIGLAASGTSCLSYIHHGLLRFCLGSLLASLQLYLLSSFSFACFVALFVAFYLIFLAIQLLPRPSMAEDSLIPRKEVTISH